MSNQIPRCVQDALLLFHDEGEEALKAVEQALQNYERRKVDLWVISNSKQFPDSNLLQAPPSVRFITLVKLLHQQRYGGTHAE